MLRAHGGQGLAALAVLVNVWTGGAGGAVAGAPAGGPPGAQAGLTPVPTAAAALPMTGRAVPELAGLDAMMGAVMTRWSLPGGQLAVARDGRLVLNRGYGLGDVESNAPVEPTALFRIASTSKPITVVAILGLLEEGRLSLDDRAFRLLDDLAPPVHAAVEPRLYDITIRDLLQHTGGWDSSKSRDPQYQPWTYQAAAILGVPAPPSAVDIIRVMLPVPLDFPPGTRTAYSNFGYNVLGRVIERASGLSYGEYTQARVLTPAGITNMRLGRTRLADRAPGEVRYYGPPGQALQPSVFAGEGYVPFAYGEFYMEAMDAHGGWLATASDLVRFATAVDGQRGPALLRPDTVDLMLHTPLPLAADPGSAGAGNARAASGLGWVVQQDAGGLSWSHTGALEGSNASWLIRRPDGLTVAWVFNSLPEDVGGFFQAAIPASMTAIDAVSVWPTHDLFAAP